MFLSALPPLPDFSWVPSRRGRYRKPDHHAEERRHSGIPHGVPGAKLARKAAAGRIGSCTLR